MNDYACLGRMQFWAPKFFSDRDFLFLRDAVDEKDEFFINAVSVYDDDYICKVPDGVVRGDIRMAAWYVKKLGDKQCEVQILSDISLNGWIPEWIAKWVVKDNVSNKMEIT